MQDRIEYEALVQKALRNVIRDVLADVAKNGLPGEHHFYITFFTQKPGVEISNRLKERFPETMTIVLQHRFWDMELLDDAFTVTLSFDGIAEKLVIPFSAMQLFYDPTAAFEVAFNTDADNTNSEDEGDDNNNSIVELSQTPQTDSEVVSFPSRTQKETATDKDNQPLNLPKNFMDVLNKTNLEKESLDKTETEPKSEDTQSGASLKSEEEGNSQDNEGKEDENKSARILSLDAFRNKDQ